MQAQKRRPAINCFIPKQLKWQMTGGGVIVPGLFC